MNIYQMMISRITAMMFGMLIISSCWATEIEPTAKASNANPVIEMHTSKGMIEIELNAKQAPITVENFLNYAKEGFYDGLIFHRVIDDFMIQGGGFTQDLNKKPTKAPIKNEAANGLDNTVGTIAMARTQIVDSATAQFFINLKNNAFLNHTPGNYGYAVFGRVTQGLDVVKAIGKVPTRAKGMHQNVPIQPVIIEKIVLK